MPARLILGDADMQCNRAVLRQAIQHVGQNLAGVEVEQRASDSLDVWQERFAQHLEVATIVVQKLLNSGEEVIEFNQDFRRTAVDNRPEAAKD